MPRLRAVGRALLFLLLFMAFLLTAALLAPVRQTELPAGEGIGIGFILPFILALAAALAAAWVLRVVVERRPADGLGFPLTRRAAAEATTGVLAGAAAVGAVIVVLSFAGVFVWSPDGGTLGGWLATSGAALAAFAIPAAAEEAVFRGYLLDSLRQAAGPGAAVALTALFFGAVHGGNPGIAPLAFVNLTLAGVLLAVAVLRTGTLWLATGVHLGWNWVTAAPLDLPVSGLEPYDTPLYDAAPAGSVWLSGGAFGPEGGLAGTAAACAAFGLILWLTRPGAPLALALSDRSM